MAIAAAVLVGCGGGGDAGAQLLCATCTPEAPTINVATTPAATDGGGTATPAAGTVEGYWTGTSGPYEFGSVVLADGQTYVVYTRGGVVEGLMVGKTTADAVQFSASVVDFNAPLRAITPGTLAGQYTPSATMTATAKLGSTLRSFSARFDATYNTAVDLAGLAGTWSGTGASKDGFTAGSLQIGADGAFSGSTPLCGFVGSLAPYSTGKHPLKTTTTFSGARCPLAGKTVVGIAVVSEASGRRQLLTTGIAADQSDGFFGLLTKQ